nr:hypothetical protein [Tanacetum cinerariifolium]
MMHVAGINVACRTNVRDIAFREQLNRDTDTVFDRSLSNNETSVSAEVCGRDDLGHKFLTWVVWVCIWTNASSGNIQPMCYYQ